MTGRSVAKEPKERRSHKGQRVHFEAMVAIGGAEGGAGFEAESVDVSAEGMRLRTAYLPAIGDQLVFRFDGPGGEIIAQGEVAWATEEARGGEFAVKFVDLDEETERALKEMCASDEIEEPSPPGVPEKSKTTARGTRVKLHIEGLASPMKARVKDGDLGAVSVGSSLEFLKLGRHVEIEDVDHGERRDGFVDGVKVEIDPATSVPQLVVSLRFDAAMVGMIAPEKAKAPQRTDDDAPVTRAVPAPSLFQAIASAPAPAPAPAPASAPAPAPARMAPELGEVSMPEAPEVEAAAAQVDPDEEMPFGPNKIRVAQDRAMELTSAAAKKIGPAFAKMGQGARGLFGSMRQKLEDQKKSRDATKKASAPRRVTAPPPSGALKSDGKRLVREEIEEGVTPLPPLPKRRRSLAIGAAAGLVLVIGVVSISRAIGGGGETQSTVAAEGMRPLPPAPQVPPIPGSPAVSDVPLFGPTTLSTTEQVTEPPKPAEGAQAKVGVEEEAEETAPKSETVRQWGSGEVSSARVLKVKMDGPIDGFIGKESEDGFTITVPGRKSTSSSSGLVRKDKRLSGVDVINRQDGAEIAVRFKGETPGYLAKIRGDRIEIALSGAAAEPKTVAQKKSPTKKKSATKKKPAAN